MTIAPIHRRRFLLGAGGAAVALPALPSLLGRDARAADGDVPRRLVCIYSSNCWLPSQWIPTGGTTDFTLSPMLGAFEPLRDRVIVAHGITGNGGHYAGHSEALTGQPNLHDGFAPAGGPSLDQLLGAGLAQTTPLPSLELAVDASDSSDGIITYAESGLAVPPIADAIGGFERVYGLAHQDPALAERRRSQDLSVLDAVMDHYESVNASLSAGERRVLDEHLTLLRAREQALMHPVMIEPCEVGAAPMPGLDFAGTTKAHLDTITAAFRCDITRVATVVLGGSGAITQYPWLGIDELHHTIAHGQSASPQDELLAIGRWHAEQVAYLMSALAAIPEDDATVLDRTAVLWITELGLSQFDHARDDVPVVIGGGCGGSLATGRYLDLGGRHYHDLLLTMARAMGRTDVASFGTDGTAPIEELLA